MGTKKIRRKGQGSEGREQLLTRAYLIIFLLPSNDKDLSLSSWDPRS